MLKARISRFSSTQRVEKCVIVGSGPAGISAGIYAARAALDPIVIHGNTPLGQLAKSPTVDNYPGYVSGGSGLALMLNFKKQAEKEGVKFVDDSVVKVESVREQNLFRITTLDKPWEAIFTRTIIAATGTTAKHLDLPRERQFIGKGVSNCATCDGTLYRGRVVSVVGGGDYAAESALYLSGMCQKVYLIHRGGKLCASKPLSRRVYETENIETISNSDVKEYVGDERLSGLVLEDGETKRRSVLSVDAVFVAIGRVPNTKMFERMGVEVDSNGYIKVDGFTTRTSIPGVFAAGYAMDGEYSQAIVCSATGCMAALDAEKYLMNLEN